MSTPAQYIDPDVFQAERRDIFAHSWQIAGDLEALKQPGDYVCANLAGFAAFVIRDHQNGLQAFRNVCRHQQMPILDNGVGHCDSQLRCRYHGWTYDFTGKCTTAPPQVRPSDFDTAEYRLDSIQFAQWQGLVAVNFADDPKPITSAFADIDVGTAPTSLIGRDIVRVFANWKAIVDEIVAGEYRPLPQAKSKRHGKTGLSRHADNHMWMWHTPTLSLYATLDTMIVLQVVPRTFLKSEIHWYLFGDRGAVQSESGARAVEQIAKAAETRQEHIKAQNEVPPLADEAAAAYLRMLC
ncbi:MAG: aromatic ring-hydroxylating oxygenase subunit alpha [Alphaproteobacteria bacterium]